MIRPDYKEFYRLSRQATLVPVAKSISADLLTPVSAFLAVADGEPDAFLLESVEGGEKIGRYTFLGVRPFLRLQSRGESITIERGKKIERRSGKYFRSYQRTSPTAPPSRHGGLASLYRRRGRVLRL
jgi:anthranilate synthase component 1